MLVHALQQRAAMHLTVVLHHLRATAILYNLEALYVTLLLTTLTCSINNNTLANGDNETFFWTSPQFRGSTEHLFAALPIEPTPIEVPF